MLDLGFLVLQDNELLFAGSTIFGAIAHYFKKYARGQTTVPIWEWFGKANAMNTMMMFGALCSAIVAALASGVLVPGMSMWAVVWAGLATGFAVDSGFNADNSAQPK